MEVMLVAQGAWICIVSSILSMPCAKIERRLEQ